MVKILLLLVMLLILGACTGAVSKENGEMSPPPQDYDAIIDIEIDYETTDDAETPAYFIEDVACEYDVLSREEPLFIIHENTDFLYGPPFQKKYQFVFPGCPDYMDMDFGQGARVDVDVDGFLWMYWIPRWHIYDIFYDAATPGRGACPYPRDFIFVDDGRVVVTGGSSGWPGPLRDPTYDVDENVEIMVITRDTTRDDDNVRIFSRLDVLTQIPEFWEDDFLTDLRVTLSSESQIILYEERESSKLWQWLMDEENAWRITVNDPRPFSDIFQDVSGDLWYTHGIQIFSFAGDATIMSRRGILSQFPELQEDNLYFDLYVGGGFEMQYIMLHEQPESKLWQLMVELRV